MNRDCHSRHGAEMLARRIETYWRSLGFNARTWLVPLEAAAPDPRPRNALKSDRLGALWLVRSSLANACRRAAAIRFTVRKIRPSPALAAAISSAPIELLYFGQ